MNKVLFSSGPPLSPMLKPAEWPPSFRPFAPLQVGAYPDGFSLSLQQTGGVESGIYVVPGGMEIEPRSRGRAHFELLREGIYWYRFSP